MTNAAPLKLLLVDDHEVVRRGLAALLEGYGTGGRADAALRRLEGLRERGRYH